MFAQGQKEEGYIEKGGGQEEGEEEARSQEEEAPG